MLDRLLAVLKARFGSAPALSHAPRGVDVLADMADRRVMRRYLDKPVDPALLETLCAVALSAPSKSDLQQADIVIVSDKGQREKLEALLPDVVTKSDPQEREYPTETDEFEVARRPVDSRMPAFPHGGALRRCRGFADRDGFGGE